MSIYDSLGEVTFSINDPTLSKSPPFKYTRTIAYNGNYWLAAGTIVVRDVTVKSFLDVMAAESSAESAIGYHKSQGDYNSPIAKAQVKSYLDQATEIFLRYKDRNYVPQTYHKYSAHCFAKSTDGLNWKYVEECPFVDYNYPDSSNRDPGSDNPKQVRGLCWNGTKWMAVGVGGQYVTNPNNNYPSSPRIATSTDGDIWDFYTPTNLTNETDLINLNSVDSVTCDTTRWMIGTNTGIWKQNFDSSTWTRMTESIRRTKIKGIATNGSTIVGVGEYDGQLTGSPSNYYDKNLASSIISSTDNGVTWASRVPYETYVDGYWATRTIFKAVAWNGDKWVAVGERQTPGIVQPISTGIIGVSEDGVDWITSEGFSSGLSSVSWDGNEWLVGSSNGNILISRDGLQWKTTDEDTSGTLAIGTPILLPILGGDINTVQSLLVGSGTPTSVLRTYDGTNWIQQLLTDQKKYRIGNTPSIVNSVVWSGTKWVMVGSQTLFKTIMVSGNGIDWEYPTTTLEKGNGVAYNGGLYVAVGEGISTNGTLVTSSDAVTWTPRTSPIKSLRCVASNGTKWVAGGNGGIIYSSNGTTWTKSVTCPLTVVNGVAWNGYYWVATGIGPTCIIALSKDGMRWYQADPVCSSYLQEGNSVAWNGTIWLAVGRDPTNCILYSDDGYIWKFTTQKNLTNGIYVAWTGTNWLVSGSGSSSFITSTDAVNWTEYPSTLSFGRCFCSKSITLPVTGTSSSDVLDAVTAVLDDLTNKTNATIAEEEAAIKLAQDQAAQAVLLARRNAIKAEVDSYLTQINYWKNTVIAQFTPLTYKTYVDISLEYPSAFNKANDIVLLVRDIYSTIEAYRETIYKDSNTLVILEFVLDAAKSKLRECDENIKVFYNKIRSLYTTLGNQTFLALTPSTISNSLYNTYGFPTEIRDRISNFYGKKADQIYYLNNIIAATCNIPVTEIIYSYGPINNSGPNVASSNAPDYATLYNSMFSIDTDTLYSATYETDDSNPYYYLTIINSLYPRILPIKAQCDAIVANAQIMANHWADELEQDHTSITSQFDSLYNKYFYTLGDDFTPTIEDEDIPNKKIVLTDIPVRAFKALADTFAHPISYPTALQALYDRLKLKIDSVASNRQTALDYMTTKRKTVINNALNYLYQVTKTKYTEPLLLDQNLSDVAEILYYKNSDYQSCVNLLKLLKSAYVLYPTMKDKYLAIDLADIEAEEDGCVPPSAGWGTTERAYPTFNINLETQSVLISYSGSRYLLNDTIKILGTSIVGGTSPTNDITVTVLDVGDFDGRIIQYSTSGTLPTTKTYTGIIGSRYTNLPVNFNVTPSGNGYTVSLVSGGSGYVVGQTILLKGSQFARTTGTNDIIVTVTNVNIIGGITEFTYTGNSQILTIDDVTSYKNCSASFTFVGTNPAAENGKNFNIILANPGTHYKSYDAITIPGNYLGGLSPKNDVSIAVGSVTSSGSILNFSYIGTPSTTGVYGQTVSQLQNTSATFTFSNITSATNFTCSIKNGGSGYIGGDRIIILGSSFPGGTTPANDFTLRVSSVTSTGGIDGVTLTTGNFGFLFQTFNRSGNVIEQNAAFDITTTFNPTPSYSVTINSPGNGYTTGEQITILGTNLDGVNETNDLIITVGDVTNSGAISTFTYTGTPKTIFNVKTTPKIVENAYIVGRPGLHGWEKYNNTFNVRGELINYMGTNSIQIESGVHWTFHNPGVLLGEGVPWRQFLDFTKNTTYSSINDTIASFQEKIDALNSNDKLNLASIDALVSVDLINIQSKFVPYATNYIQGLIDDAYEKLPFSIFLVTTQQDANDPTRYNYNVTLKHAGYGYVKDEVITLLTGASLGAQFPWNDLTIKVLTVGDLGRILTFETHGYFIGNITPREIYQFKLADRFTELAYDGELIQTNYSTLINSVNTISGKLPSEIQIIVNNAVNAYNAIINTQNSEFINNIKKALLYLEYFNNAKTTVNTLEDDLKRWKQLKENIYTNTPYEIGQLSRSIGDPFIMSIPPTNTDYWIERTYPTYTLTQFGTEIHECTRNQQTGKIETTVSVPFGPTDISEYSQTVPYKVGDYAKYNNKFYKCILDNTPDILDTSPGDGVKGFHPISNPGTWKTRIYPNVLVGDNEQEYSDDLSVLLNPDNYTSYDDTKEYGIGSVAKDGYDIYYCGNVVTTDSLIAGIPPTNTRYWIQTTYPIVANLDGTTTEADPSNLVAVNPTSLTDVTAGNIYKVGDFGKATVGFVDDSGYYHQGTTTFQLDQDTETLLSKGYPPVYYYDSTHKYQNASMWQHVQDGVKSGLTVLSNSYSNDVVYKKGDYAIYNGQFYYADGTLSTSGYHTFVLIAPYLAYDPRYSNRAKGPLYEIKSNYPLATKTKGNLPTTTPWQRLESVSQSDSTPSYSNTQTYVINDIVKYTDNGTTYKYKFVGTLDLYNSGTIAYMFFGTVSSNKSGWGIRSYPAVYYNGELVDPSTIPPLDPNDFPAYDSEQEYTENTSVSYNGSVYMAKYGKINSIIGVPVTNSHYWTKIRYQLIVYDGDPVEAVPGSIPLLNSDDFEEYSPTETYFTGDVIKVTNSTTDLNLSYPLDVVTSSNGSVYIINRANNIIKQVKFESNFQASIINIGRNILLTQTNYTGSGSPVNVQYYASYINDGTTINATYSNNLTSIAVDDTTDTIYFSDSCYIRKITSDGNVTKYTNGGLGYLDGDVSVSKFGTDISGLIIDKLANCLYVSDTNNHRIRKINLGDGSVVTLAGSTAGFANGVGAAAKFNFPRGIDIDSNGNIYVADSGNHCVRKVTSQGSVSKIAGFVDAPGHADGTGTDVRLKSPYGIAVDSSNYIYVSEPENHCIRRISPQFEVLTYIGGFTQYNEPIPGNVDDIGQNARLNSPHGMSFDNYDNLYVADSSNNKIRKIRGDAMVLSVVKDNATIYECVLNRPYSDPIVNIPPTNTTYWEEVAYPEVFIDDVAVEANPNNTSIFKALDQYDYVKYDNNWMYKFGDRVSYNGKVYDCKNAEPVGDINVALTGVSPPNDIYWKPVDNIKPLGVGLNGAKNWYDGKPYKVGDVVYYLNKIYKCVYAHTGNANDLPNRARRWQIYLRTTTTPIPIWSNSGVSYKIGDIVTYESKKYICVLSHTSDNIELPNRIMKWEPSDQSSSSNIVFWELNVQYLVGTVLAYNGYFYRCEFEHYSTYEDSPEDNKYYWSKVVDLTEVGLPAYYDSESSYFIGDTVTFREKNTQGAKHYEYLIYSTFTTATSTDAKTWSGSKSSPFSSQANGAAYNGTLWVAVGSGDYAIATSTDGENWTGRSSPLSNGYAVAWNETIWVAVGEGTASIATSTDGINWTARSNPLNVTARGVAWNGTYWLAVGSGTYMDELFTDQISVYRYTVAKSYDGSYWTPVTYNPDPNYLNTDDANNKFPLKTIGNSVAWNGSYWIVVGSGINSNPAYNDSTTIVKSSDGDTWNVCLNPINFNAIGIKWNGTLWVAVGQGTASIATSTNGTNWTARRSPFVKGTGIEWNGSTWLAVGQLDTGTIVATSLNGTTWKDNKGIFNDYIYGVVWGQNKWLILGPSTTAGSGPVTEIPNPESVYTIVFYECIKSNVNYPSEYTYDNIVILPSTDGFGNYQTARIAGTWQKNNLPRYGTPDKDPFRIKGFAGELRRRVWMEIEMPYRRLLDLKDYDIYRTRHGVDYMMSTAFSFTNTGTGILHPTDYETDYETIKNIIIPVIDDFILTEKGYYENEDNTPVDPTVLSTQMSIDQLILRAYDSLYDEIKQLKTLPYEPITTNITTEGDSNKCIDQLIFEINTMKMQYFYNPGTQAEIRDDPYKFMSAVALAKNPPQKLFRDLGVGDIDEITQYLKTHPPTYPNVAGGKYTEQTLKQVKEANDILESKLELVSMRCYEIKLKLGVGVAMKMLASPVSPGARIVCDSGVFDLPIGDWDTLNYYQSPPPGGLLEALFDLINTSCTPPEYTLPNSQATRDLAVITYEVQDVNIKNLGLIAKGVVGITAALFEGRTNVVSQLVNGISSLHALVLESKGQEIDQGTAETIAYTNTNFAAFNRKSDSIALLKQQVDYYKNAVDESYLPSLDNLTLDVKIDFLTRIGILLQYLATYKRQLTYGWITKQSRPLPRAIKVPSLPDRVIIEKPKLPDLEITTDERLRDLLKQEAELRRMETRLRNNIENLKANKLTVPPFEPDIPTTIEVQIEKTLNAEPPPPSPYQDKITTTRIRTAAIANGRVSDAQKGLRKAIMDHRESLVMLEYHNQRKEAFRAFKSVTNTTPAVKFFPITIKGATYEAINSQYLSAIKQEAFDVAEADFAVQERVVARQRGLIDAAVKNLKEAKVNVLAVKLRLNTLQRMDAKWIERWKANNPAQSIIEYGVRNLTDEERIAQLEEQRKIYNAKVAEIEASNKVDDALIANLEAKKAQTIDDLNRKQLLVQVENLGISRIRAANDLKIRAAEDELTNALAAQDKSDYEYNKALRKREVLLNLNRRSAIERKDIIKQLVYSNDENIRVTGLNTNLNTGRVTVQYEKYERILYDSPDITGNWAVKLMKKSVIAIVETIQTAIALTLGIGELPYSAEEIISGRYFYNKLSPQSKARIDRISTFLNGLDDAMTPAEIQTLEKYTQKFIDSHTFNAKFKAALANIQTNKGYNQISQYRKNNIRGVPKSTRPPSLNKAVKGGDKISKGLSTLENTKGGRLKKLAFPTLYILGETRVERFFGGLGLAMEVGGAALAAWQGGAFSEGETLGL